MHINDGLYPISMETAISDLLSGVYAMHCSPVIFGNPYSGYTYNCHSSLCSFGSGGVKIGRVLW